MSRFIKPDDFSSFLNSKRKGKNFSGPTITIPKNRTRKKAKVVKQEPEEPLTVIVNDQELPMSKEQMFVFNLVVNEGKSVFFTGSAGTGKSALLRKIIQEMIKKQGESSVAVTASTGMAACNISGQTIHSFAGCGLAVGPPSEVYKWVMKSPKAIRRWQKVQTLIIDEVSMIDGDLFDKLEYVARKVRENELPFGGIQLIITGDFMQLPPVKASKYCFEASKWQSCVPFTFRLNKVFRQSDQTFVNILNEIRTGKVSDKSVAILKGLSRPVKYEDGLMATQIFPRRAQAQQSNRQHLDALPSKLYTFKAKDWVKEEQYRKFIKEITITDEEFNVKVGAQVIYLKNDKERGLVNGSRGKVVDIDEEHGIILGEFLNSKGNFQRAAITREVYKYQKKVEGLLAKREQFPLLVSYAVTVHKSQGLTLDRLIVDLAGTFESGQAYVALSRATCMNSLQVLNFKKDCVKVSQRVLDFNNRLNSLIDRPK